MFSASIRLNSSSSTAAGTLLLGVGYIMLVGWCKQVWFSKENDPEAAQAVEATTTQTPLETKEQDVKGTAHAKGST